MAASRHTLALPGVPNWGCPAISPVEHMIHRSRILDSELAWQIHHLFAARDALQRDFIELLRH